MAHLRPIYRLLAAMSFVACAGIYVGNTWSPSSYALALQAFDVPKASQGLVFGAPRPIRSDEWAVVTPLTQATVNNGFQRYNHTSFYDEDLRSTYSMPILDWGFAFKPTFWLFPLVNPAYAFSLHWFLLIALFMGGYSLLGRAIGLPQAEALLVASLLYFSAYAQRWWTTFGPLLALFPWVVLAATTKKLPIAWRAALFYYTAVAWMISSFYPPLIVSLALTGAALAIGGNLLASRKADYLWLGVAGALAAATVVIYLQDYLVATAATVYPGQRRSQGGNSPFELFISQFLPTSQSQAHESLIDNNICEISVVGTFYLLAVLFFLEYRRLETQSKRFLLVIGATLAAMWAWMYWPSPIPTWLGAPLLWHYVPPARMAFATGVVATFGAVWAGYRAGLQLTLRRTLGFCGTVVGACYYYKVQKHGFTWAQCYKDIIIVVPVVLMYGLRKKLDLRQTNLGLGAASVVVAVLTYAFYNPVQSTWPIFNRPATHRTHLLDEVSASSVDGTVYVEGFPAGLLNGYGYRSVNHVLPTPQLQTFHRLFPQMNADQFQHVFNRYAQVNVTSTVTEPMTPQADMVLLPPPNVCKMKRTAEVGFTKVMPRGEQGHIDSIEVGKGKVTVVGWAPWAGKAAGQKLSVVVNKAVKQIKVDSVMRTDVATAFDDWSLNCSGFRIEMSVAGLTQADRNTLQICVMGYDKESKVYSVTNDVSDMQNCKLQPRQAERT